MTNRNSVPDFAGLFGGLSTLLGDTVTKEFFPASDKPAEEAGPKYKRVSDLGIGAEVVKPDGTTVFVETLTRAGDDGSVEIVFSDQDVFVLLPNMQVEVK